MNVSNNVLDLRVRRTRKFLWDALLTLIEERDFESTSVTEICEQAMVHRTTFYKHFEDKYALLQQGIEAQITLLFEDLNLTEDLTHEVVEKSTLRFYLVKLFEHVDHHKKFYRLMLCGNGVGQFNLLFRKSLTENFMKRSASYPLRHDEAEPMRYLLRAHAHAGTLVSAISWWLESDCPFTPQQMGRFLLEDAFS
jgi:AcrR family transcriptional regulator